LLDWHQSVNWLGFSRVTTTHARVLSAARPDLEGHATMSLVRWFLNLFPDAAPRRPLREDRLPDDELLREHSGTS